MKAACGAKPTVDEHVEDLLGVAPGGRAAQPQRAEQRDRVRVHERVRRAGRAPRPEPPPGRSSCLDPRDPHLGQHRLGEPLQERRLAGDVVVERHRLDAQLCRELAHASARRAHRRPSGAAPRARMRGRGIEGAGGRARSARLGAGWIDGRWVDHDRVILQRKTGRNRAEVPSVDGVLNSPPRRHSSAVEQLFRKQQVLGSNPSVGSTSLTDHHPLWFCVVTPLDLVVMGSPCDPDAAPFADPL